MRRLLLIALFIATSWLAVLAPADAQETNLETGVYADPLTGFGVTWDPAVFTGTQSEPGVLQLEGLGSNGTLSTTSAATATECLERVQAVDPLAIPDMDGPVSTPESPHGSQTELGVNDGLVYRACLADPAHPASTIFILLTITGPGPKAEWDAAMAAWQPVIDSIQFPDPALMTFTGINGDTYTDPLYGWSVQFDPVRYEAQYAAGTADSPYLSGLFLYAEGAMESGGVWAERHDSVETCLEAQRAVNSDLPGFAEVPESEAFTHDVTAIRDGTWTFQLEPDGAYVVWAGCQPLMDQGAPSEGVFLVTTFTVPAAGYSDATATWSDLLKTLTFRNAAPKGTPAA